MSSILGLPLLLEQQGKAGASALVSTARSGAGLAGVRLFTVTLCVCNSCGCPVLPCVPHAITTCVPHAITTYTDGTLFHGWHGREPVHSQCKPGNSHSKLSLLRQTGGRHAGLARGTTRMCRPPAGKMVMVVCSLSGSCPGTRSKVNRWYKRTWSEPDTCLDAACACVPALAGRKSNINYNTASRSCHQMLAPYMPWLGDIYGF